MLAANGQAAYISEPLNVLHRPGIMSKPVEYWYTYICADNEDDYLPALRQTLAYRYHLLSELFSLRSRKDVGRMGRDWNTFRRGRRHHLRPLLKDPFAVFSAPWFASRLGCQVVITVRHPAAFVSSLKRMNWNFQLQDLLAQPLLMRDWLEPYRNDMKAMSATDIIGRAALLWTMTYAVVEEFRKNHPHFRIVRHEDLSLDPVRGFRLLYSALDLDFTPNVQTKIVESSSSENPSEVSASDAHSFRVDSRANLHNWKRRLSPAEIDRIRIITADISECYYSESTWG
jgi:hypothetical protein